MRKFVMPLTLCASLILLVIAFIGPGNHPFFSAEALWSAFLMSAVLVQFSRVRSLFLNIIAVLGVAFFLQRIVVLYFWPDKVDYQPVGYLTGLVFTNANASTAMFFCLWCFVAVGLGYCAADAFGPKPLELSQMRARESIRIFFWRIEFEAMFLSYAKIAVFMSCVQLALLFHMDVGVKGYIFNASLASLLRLTYVTKSLSIICFIPFLIPGMSRTSKRLAAIELVLQLVVEFGDTARGAPLLFFLQFLLCAYFVGAKLRAKHLWLGGVVLAFVMLFYGPLVTARRNSELAVLNGQDTAIGDNAWSPAEKLSSFSMRLGGFDLVTAFITVGRDAFPDHTGLIADGVLLIHSFVPKEIWPKPEWIPSYFYISHLLRGVPLPTEETQIISVENFEFLGGAYVYYGFIGGIIFAFVWSMVSALILSSRINRVYKILYCYYFVVLFFSGGTLLTPMLRAFECAVALVLAHYFARRFRTGSVRASV